MHKHTTGNKDVYTKVLDKDHTCEWCGHVTDAGTEVEVESVEVRFFAGEYMVEHDHEEQIECARCVADAEYEVEHEAWGGDDHDHSMDF